MWHPFSPVFILSFILSLTVNCVYLKWPKDSEKIVRSMLNNEMNTQRNVAFSFSGKGMNKSCPKYFFLLHFS